MSDERSELDRLRKLKRMRELEAKAGQAAPAAAAAPSMADSVLETAGAAGRGAGQGFTFGQGVNINGLIQALGEKYLPESAGGGGKQAQAKSIADLFLTNKGSLQRENDAAWDKHPWAYGLGNTGGTVASMFLPLGAAAKGVGKSVEAASAVARGAGALGELPGLASLAKLGPSVGANVTTLGQLLARGGRSGLIAGAANGIGNGLYDLARGDLGGFAGDVAMNAVPGALMGAGLAPVPRMLGNLAPKLEQFAYRRAVKAAGPILTDVRALQAGGRLESVGKKLMEMGLIPRGAGAEEIANAVEHAAGARGSDVGAILGELDSLAAPAIEDTAVRAAPAGLRRTLTQAELSTPNGLTRLPPALESREMGNFPGALDLKAASGTVNQRVSGLGPVAGELPGFNPARVGARARAELLDPLRDQPALQGLVPGLEEHIANLEALGNRRLAFTRANDVKRGYDKLLNWDKEQTPAKELLKQFRGLINEEIEKGADAAATASGNTELLGRFRSAKHDYRDLRQVADFARDRVARMQANNTFSLPDALTGIGGAVAGAFVPGGHSLTSLLGGAAASYASKVARERGNSLSANAALDLARSLGSPRGFSDRLSQRMTSWPVRSQGLRALSDLLGGARLPWLARDAEPALETMP